MEQIVDLAQIVTIAPESLASEIVRYATCADRLQPVLGKRPIAADPIDADHEPVAAQTASTDLSMVALHVEDLQRCLNEWRKVGYVAAGQMNGEALRGNGLSVLQPRVTDSDLRHAGEARQCARDLVGVAARLAHRDEHVLTRSARHIAQVFLDDEVFGRRPQRSRQG